MKKSLLLLVMISLGITWSLAFAQSSDEGFTDTKGTNANLATNFLKKSEVVEGFNGGTEFHPQNDITRAEFLKMTYLAMDEYTDREKCLYENQFADVSGDEWFVDYVCHAVSDGVVQGYEDGSFRPNDPRSYIKSTPHLVSEVPCHNIESHRKQLAPCSWTHQ